MRFEETLSDIIIRYHFFDFIEEKCEDIKL